MRLIIAIDGPAASGKSTVSRRVAARLGCIYVDSGSLYRGLTWKAMQAGVSPADAGAVLAILQASRWEFVLVDCAMRFTIDGADPGTAIRTEAVNTLVSAVAAMPPVREWVVAQLRGMTRFGGLVVEGRDIGTVVFPDTPFKFYLDADPAERARRRSKDLDALAEKTDVAGVKQSLDRRDQADSTRRAAPLRVADGARVIDTSGLTIDEVVEIVVGAVRPEV